MSLHLENNEQSPSHLNHIKYVNSTDIDHKLVLEEDIKSKSTNKDIILTAGFFIVAHLAGLYGLYLSITKAKLATILFGVFLYLFSIFGVTGGAHRLWSHRSFKATWQLKLILLFGQTLSYQHSVIHWVRDHRTHHKYSDTAADPHDASRGFFFSHIGWLIWRKNEEVKAKGRAMDISDVNSEPLLKFQHQYYLVLCPIISFVLPTVLPMILWQETVANGFFINVFRFVLGLHATLLINSAAHLWGLKPYDKNIYPRENVFVSVTTSGEGWHNYHHTFPWDYKASELPTLNLTLRLINLFAKIGWAYDLKTASRELIQKRVDRTGDENHHIWGWGDKDQSKETYENCITYYKGM